MFQERQCLLEHASAVAKVHCAYNTIQKPLTGSNSYVFVVNFVKLHLRLQYTFKGVSRTSDVACLGLNCRYLNPYIKL